MKNPRVVAVIPARGGSKGIPQKNLRKIGGKSLVQRAVESALSSTHIEAVYVSTDSNEIANESIKFGAKVIHRPPELASDEANSDSVIIDAIQFLENEIDSSEIVIAFIQCTSPFIDSGSLDTAVEAVLSNACDVAFSVTNFHGFIWKSDLDTLVGLNHDLKHRDRRQDREKESLETGAFYVFRATKFKEKKHRFFGKLLGIEVSRLQSIEIDEPEDLEMAEKLFSMFDAKSTTSLESIEALVTDFDGIHTNDQVILHENGTESVLVSRKDGLGIELLKKVGMKILIISKEQNSVVNARAKKLKIECLQGIEDKGVALKLWSQANNIALNKIAFVGNDINDIPALILAGVAITVESAPESVKNVADIILNASPGYDLVRSICEMIISAKLPR